MGIEHDRRKDVPREGPSASSMNDSGKKGGSGEKVPELKDVSGPAIDRAKEQQRNADLWKKQQG